VTTAVTSIGRWIRPWSGWGDTSNRIPGQGLCPRPCRRNGACKNLGVPMPSHKFKIGDVVTLKPAISRNVPGGTYQVTKRLPENRGEFEYSIRNLGEPYARVARESELMKA
jgi:hypothetical protein